MLTIGAISFGTVVGWIAYAAYHQAEKVDVTWLAAMIGVIGGGAVTAIFNQREKVFGGYCIGMACSFYFRMLLFSPLGIRVSEIVKKKYLDPPLEQPERNAKDTLT